MKTIKDLRKAQKLTQRETAKVLDITKEYLSMIENGRRNPSDSLKERMAKLYKVDMVSIYFAIKNTVK